MVADQVRKDEGARLGKARNGSVEGYQSCQGWVHTGCIDRTDQIDPGGTGRLSRVLFEWLNRCRELSLVIVVGWKERRIGTLRQFTSNLGPCCRVMSTSSCRSVCLNK